MAVNVFGGGPVQPALVAYRAIDLTDDLQLYWANSYLDTLDVVAANMNVTNAADTDWSITMPDATQVGVGMQCVIKNIGNSNFTIYPHTGPLIRTAVPGTAYYLLLTDNSTAGGAWTSLVYGGTTSSASAADLAGFGLEALPNPPGIATLNTNIVTVVTSDNDFAPTRDDRAKLIVWTGGSDSCTLPDLLVGDAGYYISFNNQGSGLLTISSVPPALFDGLTDIEMGIGQSLTAVWDGTNWHSIGFGQELFFQFTILNKSVAGNTNVTLTPTESSKQVQQYSGVLTGNITIYFPAIVFEWIVFNNTTGAFNLSIQLAGSVGTAYVVPQGSRQSFYSDGTSLRNVPTVIIPSTTTFPNGTLGSPGIAFTASPNTGLRSPAANTISMVAGAVDGIVVSANAIALEHTTAVNGSISVVDRTTTLDNIAPAAPVTGKSLNYDGTNWVAAASAIIGLSSSSKTDVDPSLINNTFADIPGMTVVSSPVVAGTYILLLIQVNIGSDSQGWLRVTRNGTPINVGASGTPVGGFFATSDTQTYALTILDITPDAGVNTYNLQGYVADGGTYYINASESKGGYSSMTLLQLGGLPF